MPRITRSPLVETDLLEIWLFIAEDNQRAADEMLDRIEDACRTREVSSDRPHTSGAREGRAKLSRRPLRHFLSDRPKRNRDRARPEWISRYRGTHLKDFAEIHDQAGRRPGESELSSHTGSVQSSGRGGQGPSWAPAAHRRHPGRNSDTLRLYARIASLWRCTSPVRR